jgi:DNA-directed RNA polymerase specialized sigma24 family protein
MQREPSTPQLHDRLAVAMATLDDRPRQLLELYLRGLCLSAIAATAGLPEADVRAELAATIARTRARLAA